MQPAGFGGATGWLGATGTTGSGAGFVVVGVVVRGRIGVGVTNGTGWDVTLPTGRAQLVRIRAIASRSGGVTHRWYLAFTCTCLVT